MKTAEQFLIKACKDAGFTEEYSKMIFKILPDSSSSFIEAMIEFTKMHVKAALEQASENAKWNCETRDSYFGDSNRGDYDFESTGGDGDIYAVHSVSVDKDSIINAYPETNIK